MRKFLSILAVLLLAANVSGDDAPPLLSPVPLPGLPTPSLPDPMLPPSPCFTCGGESDRLRLLELDIVLHRVKLDTYRPELTGDLLTVERGFNRKWDPTRQYELHPQGLKELGDGKYAAAILAHEAILFRRVQHPDGTVTYAPETHPNVTLTRENDTLVVTRDGDVKWIFRSYDGGQNWILERMDSLRLPGQSISLIYNGNQLSEVQYPGGAKTVLEYDKEELVRIVEPSGAYVRFGRDDYGWINGIRFYHPDHTVEKETVFTTQTMTTEGWKKTVTWRDANDEPGTFLYGFRYENDANGRITRFQNACGDEFTVEYGMKQEGTMNTHLVIERSVADGSYTVMNHIVIPSMWHQSWAVGDKDTPLSEANVIETATRKFANHRWAVVERWNKRSGRPQPSFAQARTLPSFPTPPKNGAPKKTEKAGASDGTKTIDDTPKTHYQGRTPIAVTDSHGDIWRATEIDRESRILKAHHRETGDWIYTYDDGDRMTSCLRPDGAKLDWAYDRFGQLTHYSEIAADGTAIQDIAIQYNKRGNVVLIDYPGDGSDRRYMWACGHLAKVVIGDGYYTMNFVYDARGRLIRKQHSRQGEWRYKYNLANQMILSGHRQSETELWEIIRYTWDDHGRISTRKSDAGENRDVYRADGKLAGVAFADGTREIRYYDAQNRLVALIGPTRAMFTHFKTSTGIDIASITDGDKARPMIAKWLEVNPDQAATTESAFPNF